ncbi:MAG: hypothetical protein KAI74_04845 [Kiritimatiellae bacterium]|nr:hypothetical protein [Kiritimatiellia bacterium]
MKIIKEIFLFFVTFVAVMLLCEVFVRTSHLASVSDSEFYDDIGISKRKNLNYLYFNEGFGIGQCNEFRYMGKARSPHKKENVVRVILMGDSFIEAFHVFERDYFGVVAENILSEKYPNKSFEFLNFGHSGFDLADVYTYHKTFADKFEADYILYMLSEDDLTPKYSRGISPKAVLVNDELQVVFDLDSSSLLTFRISKFFTRNFSIINMFSICLHQTESTPVLETLLGKLYLWGEEKDVSVADSAGLEYEMDGVTRAIVKSLDPQKVIFVDRDKKELPAEFKKLCLDNGFSYFDLSERLNLMVEQGVSPYAWDLVRKTGHWNRAAHFAIGTEIAEQLGEIIKR